VVLCVVSGVCQKWRRRPVEKHLLLWTEGLGDRNAGDMPSLNNTETPPELLKAAA
jgi:hypothetical protein